MEPTGRLEGSREGRRERRNLVKAAAVLALLVSFFLLPVLLVPEPLYPAKRAAAPQAAIGQDAAVVEAPADAGKADDQAPVAEGAGRTQEPAAGKAGADETYHAPPDPAAPIRDLNLTPEEASADQSVLVEIELGRWLDPEKTSAVLAAWLKGSPPVPVGESGVKGFTRVLRPSGRHVLSVPVSFPHPGEWQVSVRLTHPRIEGQAWVKRTVFVQDPASRLGLRLLPAAPDGPVLYALSAVTHPTKELLVIDARTGLALASLTLSPQADLLIPPRGSHLFIARCADADCTATRLVVLDRHAGRIVAEEELGGPVDLLAATPDGERLVLLEKAGDRPAGGRMRTYLPAEGRFLGTAISKEADCTLQALRLTRDGRRAYAACAYWGQDLPPGGWVAVFVIDLAAGSWTELTHLSSRTQWATTLLLHPDEERLYLLDHAGRTVRELDTATGQELRAVSYGERRQAGLPERRLGGLAPIAEGKAAFDPEQGALLSPDGSRLYVLSGSHGDETYVPGIFVLDTETLETLAHLSPDWTYSAIALSRDGRRLFVSAPYRHYGQPLVEVFDTETLELAASLQAPNARLDSMGYGAPPEWRWLPRDRVLLTSAGNLLGVDLNAETIEPLDVAPLAGRLEPLALRDDQRLFLLPYRPMHVRDDLHAIPLMPAGAEEPAGSLDFPTPGEPCQGCASYEIQASPDGSALYLATTVRVGDVWHPALHAYDAGTFERLWTLPLPMGEADEARIDLAVDADGERAYVTHAEVDDRVRHHHTLMVVGLEERRVSSAFSVPPPQSLSAEWQAIGDRLARVTSPGGSSLRIEVLDPQEGRLEAYAVQLRTPPGPPGLARFGHVVRGSRLYLALVGQPALAVLDLEAGTLRQVSLEAPTTLLERLLGLVTPAVEAKVVLDPLLLLSPDGETLYLSYWSVDPELRRSDFFPDGFNGEGVWVIDAETLAVRDRWLPGGDINSMRLSRDGAYLYAFDLAERSLTALDTATGRVLRQVEGLPRHTWGIVWTP